MMEFEVTGTRGIPESSILSVRAGTTRKQVPLGNADGLRSAVRFPAAVEDATSFKLEVMELLGRGRIQIPTDSLCTDRAEFHLPVDATSEAGPSMEVSFALRKLGEGHAKSASSTHVHGFGRAALSADEASDREEALTSVALEAARRRREDAGHDYMQDHGLKDFLQHVVSALMKDKPADPYMYLQTQIALRVHGSGHPLRRPGEDKLGDGAVAEALKKQIGSLSATLGLMQGELGATKQALTSSNSRLEALEAQPAIGAEASVTERLESELAGLQKQNGGLADSLSDLKNEKTKLEAAVTAQASEIAELRAELQKSTEVLFSPKPAAVAPAPAPAPAFAPVAQAVPEESTIQEVAQLPIIEAPLASIKEIAIAQEDVQNLAKENAALVDELTRMRNAITAVRGEIGTLQKKAEH